MRFPRLFLLALASFVPCLGADGTKSDPVALNTAALAAHRQRSLNEASKLYSQLLAYEPPANPSAEQRALVLKFAPRLMTIAGEFFPLKDIVAIVHPDKSLIGYHLLWDDDIAYPSDNDPCDHEIVWVEYDAATQQVTRVLTYFHGAIQTNPAAAEDANAHGGRPWIGIEWGFHGSVPWQGLAATTPKLKEHWDLAHNKASQMKRDPLARGWPNRFAGSFEDFTAFAVSFDPRPMLTERDLVFVSRWPMATINRYALRYNFAVKTEWP